MATGIVEQLFIATDGAGVKQVYFRNYSVVTQFKIRSDWGGQDPESVAWGPNQNRFVVRTGTSPANHTYYLYSLPRALDVVFGPGVIPVPTLVRTETPYTSMLSVITLNGTYSETQLWKYLALRTDLTWQNPGCVIGTVTLGSTRFDASAVTSGSSGPTSFTLADILAMAATTVRYGLNSNNELVLFVTTPMNLTSFGFATLTATKNNTDFNAIANCTYGPANSSTSVTATLQSRGEAHLWVVNHTVGSVVYRTALSSPTFAITKHTKFVGSLFGPLSAQQQRQVVPAFNGCGSIDQCVGYDVAGGTILTTDLAVRDDGYEILTDTVVDSSVPYVSGPLSYTLARTDTAQGPTTLGGNTYAGGLASTYRITWTEGAWADTAGTYAYQYDVENVYPVVLTLPMSWLCVVQRRRRKSDGTLTNSQHGLFFMTSDGRNFRRIQDFTDDDVNFNSLTVLTCNKSHALWTIARSSPGIPSVYLTAYTVGINGTTKLITTDINRVTLSERFRLLDDTKDPTNGLLFDAREDIRAEPAGIFVDAWTASGYPTWTIKVGEGFPLRVELIPYEKLQVVPAGIPFPVTP